MITKHVLYFPLIAICILTGCASSTETTIRIYNATQEPVNQINITWKDKDSNENKRTFDEIRPGKSVKFDIPSKPPVAGKVQSTNVEMNYIWQTEKYDYSNFSHVGSGSEVFHIEGKTATPYLRYALAGRAKKKRGVIRKPLEEEQKILQERKDAWKKADRMEVTELWDEQVFKEGGSELDWDWVERQSEPITLSASQLKRMLTDLDNLSVPKDSPEEWYRPYEIKIYDQELLIDTLKVSCRDRIHNIPGIDVEVCFPPRKGCRPSDCTRILQKLFPKQEGRVQLRRLRF